MIPKTLFNRNINEAMDKVPDIKTFGNGDLFKLLCKVSSESEGWMKSTKAMEILNVGCVVQVTTQQRNSDGSYVIAEALVFVPGVVIIELKDGVDELVHSRYVGKTHDLNSYVKTLALKGGK